MLTITSRVFNVPLIHVQVFTDQRLCFLSLLLHDIDLKYKKVVWFIHQDFALKSTEDLTQLTGNVSMLTVKDPLLAG